MGGSKNPQRHADDNKAWLCATCHRQITENHWELTRTETCLQVVEKATGKLVARRLFGSGFNAASYFQDLNFLERGFEPIIHRVPYLTDEQLVELFQYLRSIGKHSWKAQAAILWEAKQRSVYGDRAWEAMGRTFGIGWRQAYNLAKVWEVFFKDEGEVCNRLQTCLEESTWYVVAASTKDPDFWLGYAEDQKAQNPSYSIADFKADLANAGGIAQDPVSSRSRPCPWLQMYCTKRGEPVSREVCQTCNLY